MLGGDRNIFTVRDFEVMIKKNDKIFQKDCFNLRFKVLKMASIKNK